MGADMESKTKGYQYTDCGLDNVFLENGYEELDSPYGKVVSITDVLGLHRFIAQCLLDKTGPLSGPEFRFLRIELDLSQEMMSGLLGRKERQLRTWENSDKAVGEPANTMIRFIYKERIDPGETYEEFAKIISELQKLDKHMHEMRLQATADGWVSENCV